MAEQKVKKQKKQRRDETDEERAARKQLKKQKQQQQLKQKDTPQDTTAVKHDTEDSAAAWLKENDIVLSNAGDWKPWYTFDQVDLPRDTLSITKKFDKPTPIQSCAWPVITAGRDLIGISSTGSGKSLAFGIPALAHLVRERVDFGRRKRLPRVLVLSPTRELALQIFEQIQEASQGMKCASVCVYGGVPKYEQREMFKNGVDIVIGCAGRLVDLMEDGSWKLSDIDYIVLDEADRMLDLGFEKEVRKLISATKSKRQVVMFSATWPESIHKLSQEYMHNPAKIVVGQEQAANVNITQIVDVIEPHQKEQRLLDLLQNYHKKRDNRILIFALYKKEASRLEQFLTRKGWSAVAIHGDMNQTQRLDSFDKFRSGKVPLLIATDVASRGLDIPKVEYVINFTFPLTIEDYIHRIGRTGRAGSTGIAHTFFTLHEKSKAGELVNVLRQADQKVPQDLMNFGTAVKKKEHSAYGAFFKDVDTAAKPTKITFDSDSE
ncbi:hypothetical protein MP228_011000 [Amoeboaphelidium protococcarum]|nr:hypothetical protein MP228_011000 [Amoeboaphelidium protococcarum]